jgi:hypothetical protein
MKRQPLERVRSEWVEGEGVTVAGIAVRRYTRRVGDGTLLVMVGLEPDGWHLSISHRSNNGRLTRYPRWDEIADARYRLAPEEITMAMFLPPPAEYVAVHDTTFHLHEWRNT